MRNILSPIIILILFVIVIVSTRVPEIEDTSQNKNSANFKFENVTISMHKEGKKLWTLTAKESSIYNASESLYIIDVEGNLIGENKNTLSFKSPTGIYRIKDQTLQLVKTDALLSIYEQSYFIICDEIEINAKNNLISAYGNLLINSENIMIKGRQMIADLNQQKLYLTHDIKGSIITAPTN